jgi:hypothetical protein
MSFRYLYFVLVYFEMKLVQWTTLIVNIHTLIGFYCYNTERGRAYKSFYCFVFVLLFIYLFVCKCVFVYKNDHCNYYLLLDHILTQIDPNIKIPFKIHLSFVIITTVSTTQLQNNTLLQHINTGHKLPSYTLK